MGKFIMSTNENRDGMEINATDVKRRMECGAFETRT